jgi:hypothetical protein
MPFTLCRNNAMVKYIEIHGQRVAWSEILKLRREQQKAARQPQPTLFPLHVDHRPPTQTSADGRYQEPMLFKD